MNGNLIHYLEILFLAYHTIIREIFFDGGYYFDLGKVGYDEPINVADLHPVELPDEFFVIRSALTIPDEVTEGVRRTVVRPFPDAQLACEGFAGGVLSRIGSDKWNEVKPRKFSSPSSEVILARNIALNKITLKWPDPHERKGDKEAAWAAFKAISEAKFIEYADRIEQDSNDPNIEMLVLDSEDSEERLRLFLKRIRPGIQPKADGFLQDTLLTIFAYKDVDYNYCLDKAVRRRMIDETVGGQLQKPDPYEETPEEFLRDSNESNANAALEKQMGINNLPVNAAEMAKVNDILRAAVPANLNRF